MKYRPVSIQELGITGNESDWNHAVIVAFKRKHPEHKDKRIGVTKRNGKINIFVIGQSFQDDVGDIQKGRFLVAQYEIAKGV